MGQLQGAGSLEARHPEALRADPAGEHADRAVFPRGVDPLENDDHGTLRFREQPVGEFVELRAVQAGLGLGLFLLETLAIAGVEVLEPALRTGGKLNGLWHGRGCWSGNPTAPGPEGADGDSIRADTPAVAAASLPAGRRSLPWPRSSADGL